MGHSNIAIFIPHQGCKHLCSFCNQKIISGETEKVTPEKVAEELKNAFLNPLDCSNTEIAFFGGSFTCLPKEEMQSFLKIAYPYVQNGQASGIRISTRPDSIDKDILTTLKNYGVTAIELGAQSLDDNVLLLNRRGHTASDVKNASNLIKEYGFSLGLQMMVGLYGDRKESLYKTAKEIVLLKPDTVRIYPTVVLKGTYLDTLRLKGLFSPVNLYYASEMSAELIKMFEYSDIKVIRVGLHASKEVQESKTGGAYHPAFREICESILKREELLKEFERFEKGDALTVYVPSNELSKTVGQKRSNIIWAEKQGYRITVKPSDCEKIKVELTIRKER